MQLPLDYVTTLCVLSVIMMLPLDCVTTLCVLSVMFDV